MLRRGISLVLAVAALFSLVLFSCGSKKEGVIAKVGDKTITLGDFNIAYKDISIFSRPPLVTYEDCESFLNTLIHKNLMVDEAVARGLDKDPALQEEMQQWKMQASIRALFKDVAESDLEISLAEVEDYYRRSRVSVKARHIQVESLAEAEEVAAKLGVGRGFRQAGDGAIE